MSHKRLWTISTIIAAVILIGFVFSVPRTRDVESVMSQENVVVRVPSVTLRDSFKKGVHTITGSLEASNACASVSAEASFVGEGSESGILVALTLVDDGGVCLQMPTRVTFSASIPAPIDLPIRAMVNGTVAPTTVL